VPKPHDCNSILLRKNRLYRLLICLETSERGFIVMDEISIKYSELDVRRSARQFILQLGQVGASQKTPFELSSNVTINLMKILSQIAPIEVNSKEKMIDIFIQYVERILLRVGRSNVNRNVAVTARTEEELRKVQQYISTSRGLVKTASSLNDTDLREKIARHALRLTLTIMKNRNTTSIKEARNSMLYVFQALYSAVNEPWNIKLI
jgi:hypothetical protein